MKKIANVCKLIFGYGIMVCLIVGGLTFFGYAVALCIGGEVAADICSFMKTYIIPIATYCTTGLVVFGMLTMYLAGEKSLTPTKRKK